jgi:hypothetical protein
VWIDVMGVLIAACKLLHYRGRPHLRSDPRSGSDGAVSLQHQGSGRIGSFQEQKGVDTPAFLTLASLVRVALGWARVELGAPGERTPAAKPLELGVIIAARTLDLIAIAPEGQMALAL